MEKSLLKYFIKCSSHAQYHLPLTLPFVLLSIKLTYLSRPTVSGYFLFNNVYFYFAI